MRETLKKYTLVELLVVIGLMAVLMGIALPAFSKMMKGGGVSIETRNVVGKINGARSYAVSNRQYVALIFPTLEAGVPDKLRFVSFRAAIVSYDSASSIYTWKKWIEGERWQQLSSGVLLGGPNYVGGATNDKGLKDFVRATPVTGCDLSDMGGGAAIPMTNSLVFRPNGMPADVSGSFSMGIWEGAVTTLGGISTALQVTSANNSVKLSVNPFTGRITCSNL